MQNYLIGPEQITPYEDAFEESIRRFQSLTPEEIAKNTGCTYHYKEKYFELQCFHKDFQIFYPDGNILYKGTSINPPINWRLIILNSFSSTKNIPLSHQWISYKEQPGGNVFYPSIINTVINPMGHFYHQADKEKLASLLKSLKFEVSGTIDRLIATGYFAPKIPVQLRFWAGDEDFPAGFQILFDKTLSFHMHIEDSVVLCSMAADIVRNEYSLLD